MCLGTEGGILRKYGNVKMEKCQTHLFYGRHGVPTVTHFGHKIGCCGGIVILPCFTDKLADANLLRHRGCSPVDPGKHANVECCSIN